jgi:hypothetical protein
MNSVKFKLLCKKLGLPRPYVRGLLEVMWDVAHESGNPVLGSPDGVEAAAEWTGESGVLFEALRDGRFIDQRDDGTWQIHDYWHHAPGYVNDRLVKEEERRKEKACVGCNRPFHSPDIRAVYCTNACKQAAYRQRKAEDGKHDGSVTEQSVTVTDDSVTVTNSYRSPSTQHPAPNKENTPLPPKGGKRARRKANLELEEIARRVVAYYQTTVKPDHGTEGAIENVVGLLKDGMTEESLRNCTDGFAARCGGKEPAFRMKARNFFGKAAGYKAFLDAKPSDTPSPQPQTDEQYAAQVQAERDEVARRKALAKAEPPISVRATSAPPEGSATA